MFVYSTFFFWQTSFELKLKSNQEKKLPIAFLQTLFVVFTNLLCWFLILILGLYFLSFFFIIIINFLTLLNSNYFSNLGISSLMTTVKLSESSYALIIICLLPLNSIINPLIHSTYDIKFFCIERTEREERKRAEMIEQGKELIFNQFLNFIKLSNNKKVINISNPDDSEVLKLSDLYSKVELYLKCCNDIISAISFCHENSLTFESSLDLHHIIYDVRII